MIIYFGSHFDFSFSLSFIFRKRSLSAITLTAIVIMYILCNIPRLVLNLAEYLLQPQLYEASEDDPCGCQVTPPWFTIMCHLNHFLLTLNSSANFLIYWSLGNKFKTSFKRQFLCFMTFQRFHKLHMSLCHAEQTELQTRDTKMYDWVCVRYVYKFILKIMLYLAHTTSIRKGFHPSPVYFNPTGPYSWGYVNILLGKPSKKICQ